MLNYQWQFIPVLNPDGYHLSHVKGQLSTQGTVHLIFEDSSLMMIMTHLLKLYDNVQSDPLPPSLC